MTDRTVPKYFREYLDERFDHVIKQIGAVEDQMKKINGTVVETKRTQELSLSKYVPQHNEMYKRHKSFGKLIGFASGIGVVFGFILNKFL